MDSAWIRAPKPPRLATTCCKARRLRGSPGSVPRRPGLLAGRRGEPTRAVALSADDAAASGAVSRLISGAVSGGVGAGAGRQKTRRVPAVDHASPDHDVARQARSARVSSLPRWSSIGPIWLLR